jgi:hypothetical protein
MLHSLIFYNEEKVMECGDLPTPLVDGHTSWVYSSNPVLFLYIS